MIFHFSYLRVIKYSTFNQWDVWYFIQVIPEINFPDFAKKSKPGLIASIIVVIDVSDSSVFYPYGFYELGHKPCQLIPGILFQPR